MWGDYEGKNATYDLDSNGNIKAVNWQKKNECHCPTKCVPLFDCGGNKMSAAFPQGYEYNEDNHHMLTGFSKTFPYFKGGSNVEYYQLEAATEGGSVAPKVRKECKTFADVFFPF